VLENAGLFPFLDRVAREWLGEELVLPHAATWWCGQREEREHVLRHLDSLVVKTVDRGPLTLDGAMVHPPFPAGEALKAAIAREPWRFVGQERLRFSTTPVLAGARLEPRAMTLRTFAVYDGADYKVLPGGLTRCGGPDQTYLPSKPFGGICKDTWVMGDGREEALSLWTERRERARQKPMLGLYTSSAAENLFWSGRYAERANGLMRTLRTVLRQQELESRASAALVCDARLWRGLLDQAGEADAPPPGMEVVRRLALDAARAGSVHASCGAFARAAFSVRENWSNDTWRIVTRIRESASRGPEDPAFGSASELLDHLDELLMLFQAFAGQCADSMTRAEGWQFLELGRHLERAQMMVELFLGVTGEAGASEDDPPLLDALLEAHENLITYRRAYRTTPETPTVLHLLLAEPSNPRSLRSVLEQIHKRLREVYAATRRPTAHNLAGSVRERIARLDGLEDVCWQRLRLDPEAGLGRELSAVRALLFRAGEALSHEHFKHAEVYPRPLRSGGVSSPHQEGLR